MRYGAENANGAEGWSMQLFTSGVDKMQLIYYAIKTRYMVPSPTTSVFPTLTGIFNPIIDIVLQLRAE